MAKMKLYHVTVTTAYEVKAATPEEAALFTPRSENKTTMTRVYVSPTAQEPLRTFTAQELMSEA